MKMKAKAKVNKVAEVANMMVANPKATVADVMKKFKVSKVYGYNLMSQARTKYLNRREAMLKELSARPKHRMQSAESWQTVSVTTSGQPILAGGPTEEELNADNVNHPAHYKTGGIETIDFIEAKGLNYHLGNVVKYITRADSKGNRKEDLLKAQWYLNREIDKA